MSSDVRREASSGIVALNSLASVRTRAWAVLVFLLAAVLTLTTHGGVASAAAGYANENRVMAIAGETINAVGAGSHISAGQRRGEALPQPQVAQGHGVHTYYVLAGQSPVLVHNAGSCPVYKTREFDELGNRITNAPPASAQQVSDLADYLSYRPTGRFVRGQEVYRRGGSYIVQDTTSHNGGFWKMAGSVDELNSKSTRAGTYDFLLNKVGR